MKFFKVFFVFFVLLVFFIFSSTSYAKRKESEEMIYTNKTYFYMEIQASGGVVVAGEKTFGSVVTNIDTSVSNVFYILSIPEYKQYVLLKTNVANFIYITYGDITNTVGGIAVVECYPVGTNWVITW